MTEPMPDEQLAEIRDRDNSYQTIIYARDDVIVKMAKQAFEDRHDLLAEVDRLRERIEALEQVRLGIHDR